MDEAADDGADVDEVALALERAELLEESGRTDDALALLLPVLGAHPEDPDLARECGTLLLGTGDPERVDEGVRLLRQAVALDPEDATALCLIALVLTTRPTRWGEARELTARAVGLEPHDPAVWIARAQVLKDTVARKGQAREAAERAVALAPESAPAALLLAEIAFEDANPFDKAQSAQALALADRALALDPHDPEAHVHRARADLDATPAQRQAAYLEAARLDPSRHEAITAFDDELTFPLRAAHWLMVLLLVLQGVLLLVGLDWGTVLGLLALLVVLPLGWVCFTVVRREAPPDPASTGRVDALLVGLGVALFLSVPLFRLSTRESLPWVGWVACALALVAADACYRTRRRRRRRRFGG